MEFYFCMCFESLSRTAYKVCCFYTIRLRLSKPFSYFVEITNLVPKVESMTKLRPDLNGAHFFIAIVGMFYLRIWFYRNKK